jgi:hypothetical protein
VSTSASASEENWPPSAWLEGEGWPISTVVDDRAQTVATAYGLTFFPFSVFVNADGVVLGRLSGGIPIEDVINIAYEVVG